LRLKQDKILLVADNPDYAPIEVTEAMELNIWGGGDECSSYFVKYLLRFALVDAKQFYKLWESVKHQVEEGKYTFVILDSIGETISSEIISRSAVLDLILQKPSQVDVILTGSTMPQSIKAVATEIRTIEEVL
jgi:ATP:corrinoid adenosyltransferase